VSKTNLTHFTETSAIFEDGREVPCDIVICATGYAKNSLRCVHFSNLACSTRFGDGQRPIKRLIGTRLAALLKPAWGLDEEGELNSIWKGSGVPDLWMMVGNLELCRFYSRHIALRESLKFL
jgi:hypothetical protein